MKVLFTGGGTGGHIYPALAVIERLQADPAYGIAADGIAWVGRGEGMERDIIERHGLAYFSIATGALRGRGLWGKGQSMARVIPGVGQGLRLLREFGASAVFATGGYVTAPLVVAAWLRRVPVLIYLPDMEPGMAVRWQSRLAHGVGVTVDQVAAHFNGAKVTVTGYPVRRALFDVTKQEARQRLGLDGGRPVLLVLGGSSGAHSINMAVSRDLERLLALAQVIHISGTPDFEMLQARRDQLPGALREQYHLSAYLHQEMPDALGAADLVVARAGAATLGEFPVLGLPSVLVPYPHAGQHQQPNADYLAERGAAVVLDDAALADDFAETVTALLDDPPRLASMSDAARRLSTGDGAARLAELLVEMAKGTRHG